MSATLSYRVTALPDVWPGKQTPSYSRKRAPFKANWSKTIALLAREIQHLGGTNVEFAVDVSAHHLRNDGQLRADARPRSAAVIVSFATRDGRLQFPADRFAAWQDNIDAVGRALEALRMVDRYGVQSGRQYAGFKALPATTSTGLNAQQAAVVLAKYSSMQASAILADAALAASAVRMAQRTTHPDAGGSGDAFDLVQKAKAAVEAHHGGRL